ncbi:hypothetical protein ACIREM_00795 [Streptomyces shenzhenensis]|uniref:hypothetical protein n=1 Tax=Streptomyces shenzhenensis TaxID=943815 RepID=UPI003827EF69
MAAEELLKIIFSWESENSHRGRLARALKANAGNDPALQAERLVRLSLHAAKQSKLKAGLIPA